MTVLLTVDDRTAKLAEELAKATGKTVEDVVREAVWARAAAEPSLQTTRKADFESLMTIVRRAATRPVLDNRTPDEIIGYDEFGLPR